ncbi:MAG: hypothetical protein NZS48_16715 [Gemmata sp.]|nr:hypothetical protein [Gemmata sp.]
MPSPFFPSLHGFTAVAELKRFPARECVLQVAPLHGFTAVAELKPRSWV